MMYRFPQWAIRWANHGLLKDLLETILPRNSGRPFMDPTKSNVTLLQSWPIASKNFGSGTGKGPDPFSIEALSLFLNHNPGRWISFLHTVSRRSRSCGPDFGSMNSLQHEILLGNYTSVCDLLSFEDNDKLFEERNDLNQTALHISVTKPSILGLLLARGATKIIDAGDQDGNTALFYAAAYGQSAAAIELLRNGADPLISNNSRNIYFYHALINNRIQFIEDIVRFQRENDTVTAQSILDGSLHLYVWNRICRLDRSLTGLKSLLDLGARPRWVTKKGDTLFHTIGAPDQALLLMEYCSLPQYGPNVVGHTPLMTLSWLLDVRIIRKLISFGVPFNDRDHSGWTVLEHVFYANTFHNHTYCSGPRFVPKWVSTFEIVFELLQADLDFDNYGCCACPCSPKGCLSLRNLLPIIHSRCGRRYNIFGIPWVVELFLLLRGLHKSGLRTLIASMIRRQRFDELGLTHTCCLAKGKESSCRTLSPWYKASTQERFEPIYNQSLATDDSQSAIDLHEEQAELIDELEKHCKGFLENTSTNLAEYESILVETMARRSVFLERGVAQAETQRPKAKLSQSFPHVGLSFDT